MLGNLITYNVRRSMREEDKVREREIETRGEGGYLTALHEQNIPLSLKETAMVCILWLQSYMYNRTTDYNEGMVATTI